jgi:hypothetical protein
MTSKNTSVVGACVLLAGITIICQVCDNHVVELGQHLSIWVAHLQSLLFTTFEDTRAFSRQDYQQMVDNR